ncbi:MAG: ABC transporter ATP-binding protein [Methanomicrobiales archaeon]|nr:ABC transporter ATP-binding protein [Methanomicrobiales archaeon]
MKLAIRDLSKVFVTGTGERVPALEGINLTVEDEEFLCILGPSGCGKTTLLRIIAGLDSPTTGSILVDGEVLSGPSRRIAMIFQEYSLYPWRTILDNVAFGLEVLGKSREDRLAIARKYLDLVGLTSFEKSFPYELSGGMRQRVAVARALATEPAALLMDEPFGALDAQTRNLMQTELQEIWWKTRKTILFVTHSVDEAVFLADRIVVLTERPGRVREIVPVKKCEHPRDRTCRDFVEIRRHVLDLITAGSPDSQGL